MTEHHNYLWLVHSKLLQAALGPELLVGTATLSFSDGVKTKVGDVFVPHGVVRGRPGAGRGRAPLEPARVRLSGKRIDRTTIAWREDVRHRPIILTIVADHVRARPAID